MNTGIRIDQIADHIRLKIAEGTKRLESFAVQIQVKSTLKSYGVFVENPQTPMTAETLMTELAKSLIQAWPGKPAWGFPPVDEQLKPLGDITAILNAEEINKFVCIQDGCVMKESRMPPEEFKKKLVQRIFRL